MSTSSQASINSDLSEYSNKDVEKHAPTRMYSKEITNSEGTTVLDTRTVSRVITDYSLGGKEILILGNTKVFKKELMEALGIQDPKDLEAGAGAKSNASINGSSANENKFRQFGNPAPIGLCAFAATTFLLSIINCQAKGVKIPNVVAGMAFFYGGIVQIFAGMWEIACGSTFGGCAFSSYGGFWLSYAAILTKSFSIEAAYDGHEDELSNALGFFLLTWALFTLFLSVSVMKTTLEFFALFLVLFVTFVLLACGAFYSSDNCNIAGGVCGVIVAFIAWYNAFKIISNKSTSYVHLPSMSLKRD